jgi:hypothetical protein
MKWVVKPENEHSVDADTTVRELSYGPFNSSPEKGEFLQR